VSVFKLIVISEAMSCIPFLISEVISIGERVLSAKCVVRGGTCVWWLGLDETGIR
jgi:hypothetical protein